MSESESKALTPNEGCEECKQLRDRVDSAREAKGRLRYGLGTGYRPEKSRSRQVKQVREQMDVNENAERLAQARLRIHEMRAHEGVTDSNASEFAACLSIDMRGGRDRP
jgi:hypothetical protein